MLPAIQRPTRPTRARTLSALALIAVVAAGCGGGGGTRSGGPADARLFASEWIAYEIQGDDVRAQPSPRIAIGNNGKAKGNASCNDFYASTVISGREMGFAAIGTTRQYCPSEVMAQEQAFLRALLTATQYKIDGKGRLLVYSEGSGRPVRFNPSTVSN